VNIEQFRDFCLSLTGAEETFPFGEDTLVFKVMNKMFALTSFSEPDSCNLKCDPEHAIDLRSRYGAVQPGFHMNKKHWNTISYNLDISDTEILTCVKDSYKLVVESLTKKEKLELEQMN
jgi:predicted DNA-binding protein (MmcQ/YjbR family)